MSDEYGGRAFCYTLHAVRCAQIIHTITEG
jgi:hypothetical protein